MKNGMSLALILAGVLSIGSATASAAPTSAKLASAQNSNHAAHAAASAQAGRRTIYDRVEAYDTNVHTVRLSRGEHAVIVGQGDGDTDLDLFIFDPRGRQVASDVRLTDRMYASFVAPRSGTYTVEVRNLGDVWNAYWIRRD